MEGVGTFFFCCCCNGWKFASLEDSLCSHEAQSVYWTKAILYKKQTLVESIVNDNNVICRTAGLPDYFYFKSKII